MTSKLRSRLPLKMWSNDSHVLREWMLDTGMGPFNQSFGVPVVPSSSQCMFLLTNLSPELNFLACEIAASEPQSADAAHEQHFAFSFVAVSCAPCIQSKVSLKTSLQRNVTC